MCVCVCGCVCMCVGVCVCVWVCVCVCVFFVVLLNIFDLRLRTLFALTGFKNAPNPKFVQNLSQRLSLGVLVRGAGICQKCQNLKNDNFPPKCFKF